MRRSATYNGNRIRAQPERFLVIQWQISVMPYIVADQQGDDTGCQRAQDIPMDTAKVDGIFQFSADFFKSLSLQFQSILGLIPFGSGGLEVFLDAFGNIIRINQSVADEQRIAFYGFRVLENDVLQFAMLYGHHARKIVGERGGLSAVFSQMLFQPFPAVSDGARDTGCRPQLCAG